MSLLALGLQLMLPLFGGSDGSQGSIQDQSRNNHENKVSAKSGLGRHVTFGDQQVPYHLLRSRRKTIGFQVDDRGLSVSAPKWASVSDIETALHSKQSWILRKLVEWRAHQEKRKKLAIEWRDGSTFPFKGKPVMLRLDNGGNGSNGNRSQTVVSSDNEQLLELHLYLPPNYSQEQCDNAAQSWCQLQARQWFSQRLDFFAEQTGLKPRRWGLSSARTRWGSCTQDGTIRLNWRLIHFPPDVIDYVIAHELSHLEQMNHSPQFWETVERLMPNYTQAKQVLKDYPDDW